MLGGAAWAPEQTAAKSNVPNQRRKQYMADGFPRCRNSTAERPAMRESRPFGGRTFMLIGVQHCGQPINDRNNTLLASGWWAGLRWFAPPAVWSVWIRLFAIKPFRPPAGRPDSPRRVVLGMRIVRTDHARAVSCRTNSCGMTRRMGRPARSIRPNFVAASPRSHPCNTFCRASMSCLSRRDSSRNAQARGDRQAAASA